MDLTKTNDKKYQFDSFFHVDYKNDFSFGKQWLDFVKRSKQIEVRKIETSKYTAVRPKQAIQHVLG
jgi:hypothetical protein